MNKKHYVYYDAEGTITSYGEHAEDFTIPDHLVPEGLFLQYLPLDQPPINLETDNIDLDTKNIIYGARRPIFRFKEEDDYRKARRDAYPSVGEQLGMLWDSMNRNEIPKAEPFYSRIKAVKDSIPSDNSVPPKSVEIFQV